MAFASLSRGRCGGHQSAYHLQAQSLCPADGNAKRPCPCLVRGTSLRSIRVGAPKYPRPEIWRWGHTSGLLRGPIRRDVHDQRIRRGQKLATVGAKLRVSRLAQDQTVNLAVACPKPCRSARALSVPTCAGGGARRITSDIAAPYGVTK